MPKIAACLIVKNSAGTIEQALDTIRPFVDEINVYDTGSTDGTVELLEELATKTHRVFHPAADTPAFTSDVTGEPATDLPVAPLAPIRVERGEWRDDFAWAREQSFALASDDVDWFFWMDDDDEIVGAANLRPLAYSAHESIDGFVMFYDYAQDEAGNNVCQLWRERLIRRGTGRWVNAVHEVWITEKDGAPVNYMTVPPEQVRFIHRRPLEARYAPTRNLDILLGVEAAAKEKGEPVDLRTRAYIGTELMAHGRIAEAVPYLENYLEDPSARPGDERSQVYHKLAICLRELGNPQAAAAVEHQALMERDDWTENAAGLMEAYHALGQPQRSLTWAKRVLELGMPQSVLILNPLELQFLPLVRLAEANGALGNFEEAMGWAMKAATMRPGDPHIVSLMERLQSDGVVEGAVRALMQLREILVRHDENEKAYHLLANAPYIVQDHPAVVAALAMQTENVRHMLEPEEYTRWYEDEPKESTVEDEHVPLLGNSIERAGFTLELARKFEEEYGRKPSILDLGANDAWMACFLWSEGGFHCDGVELNKASVEKGVARMERFGAPGQLVQGNLYEARELLREAGALGGNFDCYDIVTCYEVYEHVPDTDRLIETMCSLTHDEGFVCVTTPNGAYERGNLPMWAQVERKGHLRAVPAAQFAAQLLEHGDVVDLKVHHGGHLSWAALQPKAHRGKVHLFAGGAWERWSPASVREGGVGGSETALTQLAVGLHDQGFDVRVFTDADPGVYAGTLWRPAAAFNPSEYADAVIVSRLPHAFDVPINSPMRALWCHDHSYPESLTEARAAKMTDVVVLSDWQRERFARLYPFLEDKLVIRRNGILTVGYEGDERFAAGNNTFDQRDCRAIYSSSADRGLDVLLELWPEIRALAPEAELDVFYGWDVFDRVAAGNPSLQAYKARVYELLERCEGVNMRGRVGQPELYAAMSKARVWAYPTAFLETSCIGAMEARANGLAIVTSDLGALRETVGSHGILRYWGDDESAPMNTTQAYRKAFVEDVVKALTNRETWKAIHRAARKDYRDLDWRNRVAEWADLIEERAHARRSRVAA